MTSWGRTGNINMGEGRAEDTKILSFLIVHVIKNSLVVQFWSCPERYFYLK